MKKIKRVGHDGMDKNALAGKTAPDELLIGASKREMG